MRPFKLRKRIGIEAVIRARKGHCAFGMLHGLPASDNGEVEAKSCGVKDIGIIYATRVVRWTKTEAMNADLDDALIPVRWAHAQIPVVQERFLNWQRRYPYKLVCEADPIQFGRELLVAYLEKPLDPLIVGDIGAIINSVRTGLDLMMAAIVARHSVKPERAPSFPIREKPAEFFQRVEELKSDKWISDAEAAAIQKTNAYKGGDHVLWHIAKLDNLRKHQRLLFVQPLPTQLDLTGIPYAERLMLHSHSQNKSSLYRIPSGTFRPTRGNTNLAAEIFLNEFDSGVGMRPGMVAVRAYVDRVSALIQSFP